MHCNVLWCYTDDNNDHNNDHNNDNDNDNDNDDDNDNDKIKNCNETNYQNLSLF